MPTSTQKEYDSVASIAMPSFESPVTKSYPATTDSALVLSDESATTKMIIRADNETVAAAQLGAPFGSSRESGGALICGQRPTEWLVLGVADTVDRFAETIDRTGHVSIIDHTHSRALFRLTGAAATSLLEKVCSLDWSDAMTPDGSVVSASVAKVGCDIIRNDRDGPPSYLVACDRSFAQYLFDAIIDAGQEFGIGVFTA